MTREEAKEYKETKYNWIIHLIYKRIVCILWKWYNYVSVTP